MECHSPCCAEPSIRAGYRLDLFKERLAAASLKGGKPLLLQVVGDSVARSSTFRTASGEKTHNFFAILHQLRSFYQDRLGTNIGKTQNRDAFSYSADEPSQALTS